MFGPDDVLWGSAPGQGPELRNDVERDTIRANRSSPGLWFFGSILLLFFTLIPIFIAWDFISPRTFREFNYGPHPIFMPAKARPNHRRFPAGRAHSRPSRAQHVRKFVGN